MQKKQNPEGMKPFQEMVERKRNSEQQEKTMKIKIMRTILTDIFETKLGLIQLSIETNFDNEFSKLDKLKTQTLGYYIEVKSTELKKDRLPNNMDFDTSRAWRIYITKTSNAFEKLNILCRLINPQNNIQWAQNSGEHLDAIEIENETEHLHIGTEDSEILESRAEYSDWFPNRLKSNVSSYKSFTGHIDFGFETKIPELMKGEQIYFHYLIATNTKKPSVDYPNEIDCSTWYAVNQSKKFLEQ